MDGAKHLNLIFTKNFLILYCEGHKVIVGNNIVMYKNFKCAEKFA